MSEILLTIAIICVIGLAISIIILFAADKKLAEKTGEDTFFWTKK